jgi:Mn-dependent DtxR family transcriptional regulator
MKFKVNTKHLRIRNLDGTSKLYKENEEGSVANHDIADILHFSTNAVPTILDDLAKSGTIKSYPNNLEDVKKLEIALRQTDHKYLSSISFLINKEEIEKVAEELSNKAKAKLEDKVDGEIKNNKK